MDQRIRERRIAVLLQRLRHLHGLDLGEGATESGPSALVEGPRASAPVDYGLMMRLGHVDDGDHSIMFDDP